MYKMKAIIDMFQFLFIVSFLFSFIYFNIILFFFVCFFFFENKHIIHSYFDWVWQINCFLTIYTDFCYFYKCATFFKYTHTHNYKITIINNDSIIKMFSRTIIIFGRRKDINLLFNATVYAGTDHVSWWCFCR